MNKIERVQAVLSGQRPDRPPVSFWHHFEKSDWSGQAAVDAHLRFAERYDLDFVKVMNDNGYPAPAGGPITAATDLERITELNGDEGGFGAQLETLRALRAAWQDKLLFASTMFNAWATLRNLTQPPRVSHGPPSLKKTADPAGEAVSKLLAEDRSATAAAIQRIGVSLANFAAKCIEAGADGVFLSVRDDWADTKANGRNTYDELVRKTDRMILEAAGKGRFNMLHVCGQALNFEAFADYPAQVINWADRYAGPSIAYTRDRVKPAICAGLDNLGTLPTGSTDQCRDQVRDALRQAGERPILIGPGCTFDPKAVPEANLDAVLDEAKNA